jgi:hypothetical protein
MLQGLDLKVISTLRLLRAFRMVRIFGRLSSGEPKDDRGVRLGIRVYIEYECRVFVRMRVHVKLCVPSVVNVYFACAS